MFFVVFFGALKHQLDAFCFGADFVGFVNQNCHTNLAIEQEALLSNLKLGIWKRTKIISTRSIPL